ncbi:hypothetical protein I9W82_003887 [Candida metapsilosis]|uniref:Intimal thickness related receptor IRP domain-containing protein n=1 Tax=Candida metapsilosis TaxID=273372 RepID=A0A8H7ZD62_9ASCO|nr:hypothetical protein I9W82_003887 [Candida metapsilosis]
MRSFQLLIYALLTQFFQLGGALAKPISTVKPTTPYRKLFFNYQSNGACLLVNDTAHTYFELEFDLARDNETVPVMIFNYRDLINFRNVPNFNDFLNHSYLNEQVADDGEGKSMLLVDDVKKKVFYNLQMLEIGKPLPKSVWHDVITNETTYVRYDVDEPGTYCVYMPFFTYDGGLIYPTNYKAYLSVEEFMPASIYHDIAASLNIAIMFGSTLVVLSYLYPAIKAKKFEKLPPVVKQLTQSLVVYAVFSAMHLALRLIYLFMPNDFIYSFSEDYFGYFANVLLNKWQKLIISQVYFGLGYVNMPKKTWTFLRIMTRLFEAAFILNLAAVFILDKCLDIPQPLMSIMVNDHQYSIYKKSILVNDYYSNIVLNQSSDLMKYVFKYGSQTQLICGLLMQVLRLVCGCHLLWKVRKWPRLMRPMLITVMVHLIAWTLFGKQAAYLAFVHMRFSGFFDVGELLTNAGQLIETYELKWMVLSLVEVFMIWIIWSTKTPFDFSVVAGEKEEKEDKEDKKDKKDKKEKEKKEKKDVKKEEKKKKEGKKDNKGKK